MNFSDFTHVSVVVVTHNYSNLVKKSLTCAIRHAGDLRLQFIVVDNASTDTTLHMLQSEFPQVRVIRNKHNLGFAKANNLAFPYCEGKYILLLNNDAFLCENTLPTLVQIMERNSDVAAIGPKLLNQDGTIQPSCMHFPSLLRNIRGFVRAKLGKSAKYIPDSGGQLISVDAVSGACFLLRRDALNRIGLFDPDYFMYAEEVDWCYRARQSGWIIAYYPAVAAIHLGGKTADKEPIRFYVERRYSRVRFFKKHHGVITARLVDGMIRSSILIRWASARGEKRRYYEQIASLYRDRIKRVYNG